MKNTELGDQRVDNTFWLNCDCHSAHHAIRISHWKDDTFNELLLEMRVNNYKSFWKRLKAAVQYLFNFGNKNTSYDSFNLRPADVDKLLDVVVQFKNAQEDLKNR